MKKISVGFNNLVNPEWTAGGNYLKNLFIALKSLPAAEQPEIVLLNQKSSKNYDILESYIDRVLDPKIVRAAGFVQTKMAFLTKRLGLQKEPEHPYSLFLRQNQVNCLFLKGIIGPGFKVPVISWIADFQCVHLPDMFSPEEIEQRNDVYNRVIKYADQIVLSSKSAWNDLDNFDSNALTKAHILSFAAHVPVNLYDSNPTQVCETYQLPQRFFYLPNQFFKHKNHETVIEALTLVKSQYPEITVVCTGLTKDFRHPQHFQQAQDLVTSRGLTKQFIHLNVVPQEHVYQLIRQSQAVLQPSLFEGWSTSIEEAKSLGKGMIVSNLPVHREQNPPASIFFDPHKPEELAACMVKYFQEKNPGPDYELEAHARQQLLPRMQEFGRTFMRVVKFAISNGTGYNFFPWSAQENRTETN